MISYENTIQMKENQSNEQLKAKPTPIFEEQEKIDDAKLEDKAKNIEDEENDLDKTEKKAKEKRKSKFNVEGRTFKCEQCDKAYLSYPALYIHCKTKHQSSKIEIPTNISEKKRGRPKKNVNMN